MKSETLGQHLRTVWTLWAKSQPDVSEHPSWTKHWSELDPREQQVDILMAQAIALEVLNDLRGKIVSSSTNASKPEEMREYSLSIMMIDDLKRQLTEE